jgi:hypothetical protein
VSEGEAPPVRNLPASHRATRDADGRRRVAEERPAAPPSAAAQTRTRRLLRAARIARGCPWRRDCGCSKVRCHRDGPIDAPAYVPFADCLACAERLRDRSLPPPDAP